MIKQYLAPVRYLVKEFEMKFDIMTGEKGRSRPYLGWVHDGMV
jgi:hypothetical protein